MGYKNFIYFCLIFVIRNSYITGLTIPSDLELCNSGDTECVRRVTNDLIHKNAKGRSDLKLIQIDPFHVNQLVINQGDKKGPIQLQFSFSDLDIEGLSTITFEKLVGFTNDLKTSKFEMYGNVPKLVLHGKYKADGKILLLPLKGDGNAFVQMNNVKTSVKFKPKVIVKDDGKNYVAIDKMKVLLEPGSMNLKLENLFNGDPALNKQMNTFLNENWKDVWTELAPSINNAVAEVVTVIVTPMFDNFSYDDIYKQ